MMVSKKEKGMAMERALAICTHQTCWGNVDLVKDCGLIPYLLHKNHGMAVDMLGGMPPELAEALKEHGSGDGHDRGAVLAASEIERDPACRECFRTLYPYADFIDGVRLLFLEGGIGSGQEELLYYLEAHARDYDLLLLYGAYKSNIAPVLYYKNRNPKGKIYCGMDLNSRWADRILWYQEPFRSFMEAIDYRAASCTAMVRYLERKWPWAFHLVPNGSFCFDPAYRSKVPFREREKIILTVSRLGTHQKATGVLIQAFLKIAEQIPEWKLHLVGSMDPEFRPLWDKLADTAPDESRGSLPALRGSGESPAIPSPSAPDGSRGSSQSAGACPRPCKQEHGQIRPSLSAPCESRGFGGRILWSGTIVDRHRLMETYRQARIFALPSRLEGGTPNAAADALYQGLVMAVSQVDAYEDMTCSGAAGLSAPVGDVEGYARILLALCKDPDLEGFSACAYQWGREFYDMEWIVDKLYQELSEL